MSYGLEVLTQNGVKRLSEDSWFTSFYSIESHTLSPNSSKNVVISGFNPSRWAITNISIEMQGSWSGQTAGTITPNNGYVRLVNSNTQRNMQFDFLVLRGD